MLPQVAQPQFRMANDLAPLEFLFPQQNPQERTFAGPIASHEADLDVFDQRHLGIVEQHLAAVALMSILQLHQHGHSRHNLRLLFGHGPGDPTKTGEN